MSHYLVWARPLNNLNDLRKRIANGDLRCYSSELAESLLKARFDPDGWVAWEEGTFADGQRSLLERYFSEFTAERVKQGDGWMSINPLPPLVNSLS